MYKIIDYLITVDDPKLRSLKKYNNSLSKFKIKKI